MARSGYPPEFRRRVVALVEGGRKVSEAAAELGVSERHLRSMLPEIPHTRLGNRVVIPVEPLREWLRGRAQEDQAGADRVADEILAGLCRT